MKKFIFEIQNLIKVTEEGETEEEARSKVIHKLRINHYEFDEGGSAVVSEGVEK